MKAATAIERLDASEGERLRAIRLRALRESPEAFATTYEMADARPAESWAQQLADLATFVAVVDGRDVGLVRGGPHDARADTAYLLSMWVAPEARQRGAGLALIDAVVRWARTGGYARVVLDVGANNEAAKELYARAGFVPNGQSVPPAREGVPEIQLELLVAQAVPAALHGRFQDENFVVPELIGLKVERLFAWFWDKPEVAEAEHGKLREVTYRSDGALFFLKPSGRHWQRFFVDAGLMNLGKYAAGEESMLHDFEEFPTRPGWIELAGRHGLVGATISSFVAADRDDVAHAYCTIRFTDGRELVLAGAHGNDIEPPIVFSVRTGAWPTPRFTNWYEKTPNEKLAQEVARVHGKAGISEVTRFPTGLAHWVYDVRYLGGGGIVVRMTKPEYRAAFDGAAHWSGALRPIGVPLPELLARGEHEGFPYLLLERLPGQDLGVVYDALTSDERAAIAREVCRVQQLVTSLPEAPGYGCANLPGGPLHDTWRAYLGELLTLSMQRIAIAGVADPEVVHVVAAAAYSLQSYFDAVRPTPFLDDVTTKNVLVHEGRFSGIVDVDELSFGDPLLTIGLTRASLLAAGRTCDYTDAWCAELALSTAQQRALSFYTALFCVVFMSEQGQRFNADVIPHDPVQLARLTALIEANLRQLA